MFSRKIASASATVVSAALAAALFSACAKKPAPVIEEPAPVVRDMPAEPAVVAPSGPSEEELRRRRMEQLVAEVFKPVYFEFDSHTLDDNGRATVARMAEAMKEYPEINSIVIQGHTDERGTEEYNFALGEKRAAAIRNYLASYGISDERLKTLSFGQEKPSMQGSGEDAWSKNRRGEFDVNK